MHGREGLLCWQAVDADGNGSIDFQDCSAAPRISKAGSLHAFGFFRVPYPATPVQLVGGWAENAGAKNVRFRRVVRMVLDYFCLSVSGSL